MPTTPLRCACGQVQLEVLGSPILSAECLCTSCRTAGERLAALPGTATFQTATTGGTPYVLYRKDRVRFHSGQERLRELRLTPKSTTRRVTATCCNTPIFLEFESGHWLSMYASLWPASTRPSMELRTMAGDLPEGSDLPADMPNARSHTVSFMFRLLGAWVRMGFRRPAIDVGRRPLGPGDSAPVPDAATSVST